MADRIARVRRGGGCVYSASWSIKVDHAEKSCIRRGVRAVEGARLESVCTLTAYRGFESLPLRQFAASRSHGVEGRGTAMYVAIPAECRDTHQNWAASGKVSERSGSVPGKYVPLTAYRGFDRIRRGECAGCHVAAPLTAGAFADPARAVRRHIGRQAIARFSLMSVGFRLARNRHQVNTLCQK